MGKDLDVFIQIGAVSTTNSASSGAKKFRYVCPGVESIAGVAPTDPTMSQTITVTGTNFGNQADQITAKVRKPEYIISNYSSDPSFNEYFESSQVTIDTSYGTPNDFTKDYRLSFVVPPGYGAELPVVIEVSGQDSASKCAIPKQLPLGDNIDYSKVYSYPQPEITSVSEVPTSGGLIYLAGNGFGPTGNAGLNSITVNGYDGKNISCTLATVTKADIEGSCSVGTGVGRSLPISITVGGYQSIVKSLFAYSIPKVLSISPKLAKGGDVITVTGENFGVNADKDIGLTLLRDMSAAESDKVDFLGEGGVQMTQIHEGFTFIAPVSTGKDRGVQVFVPRLDGSDAFRSFSGMGLDEPSYSYFPPVITAMTKVPTSGGLMTITGTGFGETATRSSLKIGSSGGLCTDLKVVQSDTSMTCNVAEGTGGNVGWNLTVDGQVATGSTFSYETSTIETIMPTTGAKGAVITIIGKNFGATADTITVNIGEYVCTETIMLIPHSRLTCRVPDGQGINMNLITDVNGVVSPPANFSFTLFGCTDPTAQNYNELATVLDASCVFLGCMNKRSVNYDEKANKDDGSCILDPVKVTMKVKLDFQEYLSKPVFHQNVFKDDLSASLGIPKERIMILGATAGSTVFDFCILDDPAKPATEVANNLQEKIVKNEFEISYSVVEVTMKNENPDDTAPPTKITTKITTKEGEPRVSEESIIGIAACTGFILIWALSYRHCMRFCSRCCGTREKAHKVNPAPATGYPSAGTEIFPSAKSKINYGPINV